MSAGAIIGTIAIVLAIIALGVWLDRRRVSILPRPGELGGDAKPPPPLDPPGTAAAAALRLSRRRLDKAITGQHCTACRGMMTPGPAEPIRFGDKQLQLFPLTCGKCGAARGLYVDVVA